jgi:diguanylate cyclase (GGDEF)-like protein
VVPVDTPPPSRAQQEIASAVIRSIPGCVLFVDAANRIHASSPRALHVLRRPAEDLHGAELTELVGTTDRESLQKHLAAARQKGEVEVKGRIRLIRPDGGPIQAMASFTAVAEGPLGGFVTVRLEPPPAINPRDQFRSEDLTEWQLEIHELISAAAAPELVFDAVAGMVDHHLSGTCVLAFYSGAANAWTLTVESAPSKADLTGLMVRCHRPITDLARTSATPVDYENPADEIDRLGRAIAAQMGLRNATTWTAPIFGVSDSAPLGALFVVLDRPRAANAVDREVMRIAGHLSGLAMERHRDERWLTNQSLFDSLTGLAKRSLLIDRAEQAFKQATDDHGPLAAIFVQVIEFHMVNSTFGHQMGDEVLQICADRIASRVPDTDTVARFSGDEFVVLTQDPEPSTLAGILLNAVSTPIKVQSGETVHLNSRIGVALATEEDGADTLLRNANAAMQWSRHPGSGSVVVYDQSIRSRSVEQFALRGDLHRCISRGELRVHFQPKISVETGRLSGAEALLRWHHPVHGLLRPDRFISLAEESDVIVDIGMWVLRESVRQAARWRDDGVIDDHFLLAVNMSAVQLWSESFAQSVASVIEEFGWAPNRLCLELTETLLASNYEELLVALAKLKDQGVLLAADDFGTGYSALTYLDQLPLDVLKVDKGFVARLNADGTGSVVASGVVSMAKDLGLKTCAEGVENADQLSGLRALGCDWAQGYLIAKPLPAEEFVRLAEGQTAWT